MTLSKSNGTKLVVETTFEVMLKSNNAVRHLKLQVLIEKSDYFKFLKVYETYDRINNFATQYRKL